MDLPSVLTTRIKTRVIAMNPKSQRWSLMTSETPRNMKMMVSQHVLNEKNIEVKTFIARVKFVK